MSIRWPASPLGGADNDRVRQRQARVRTRPGSGGRSHPSSTISAPSAPAARSPHPARATAGHSRPGVEHRRGLLELLLGLHPAPVALAIGGKGGPIGSGETPIPCSVRASRRHSLRGGRREMPRTVGWSSGGTGSAWFQARRPGLPWRRIAVGFGPAARHGAPRSAATSGKLRPSPSSVAASPGNACQRSTATST